MLLDTLKQTKLFVVKKQYTPLCYCDVFFNIVVTISFIDKSLPIICTLFHFHMFKTITEKTNKKHLGITKLIAF